MIEYTSTAKKTREILTALMLFGLAIGIYYLSQIPNFPVPVVFQLVSILLLVFSVLIITRFVMRRFTCRLQPGDGESFDFEVIEHYGKRNTTVCRINANQIFSAARLTKQLRKETKENRKGKRTYHYTGSFPNADRALLEVRENNAETSYFLVLEINDSFLEKLNQFIEYSSIN